ncbi:MAG: hypothetical protein OXF26_05280 [Alphaproteobacteria bacterium]|nr:hypothetical protein [Alphaproteobacteria bacterium]
MMNADLITAWATVGLMLATFVTCVLIWRGIQAMNRSSAERAKDRKEAREADMRRHDEAMAALRTLIERTASAGRTGEAD